MNHAKSVDQMIRCVIGMVMSTRPNQNTRIPMMVKAMTISLNFG